MDMMAWLMLVLIAGGTSGGIALSLKAQMTARKTGRERVTSRPVWQVLLEGGINDRPDDESNDGPDEPEGGIKEVITKEKAGLLETSGTESSTPRENTVEPVQFARKHSDESAPG